MKTEDLQKFEDGELEKLNRQLGQEREKIRAQEIKLREQQLAINDILTQRDHQRQIEKMNLPTDIRQILKPSGIASSEKVGRK